MYYFIFKNDNTPRLAIMDYYHLTCSLFNNKSSCKMFFILECDTRNAYCLCIVQNLLLIGLIFFCDTFLVGWPLIFIGRFSLHVYIFGCLFIAPTIDETHMKYTNSANALIIICKYLKMIKSCLTTGFASVSWCDRYHVSVSVHDKLLRWYTARYANWYFYYRFIYELINILKFVWCEMQNEKWEISFFTESIWSCYYRPLFSNK